MRLLVVHAHPNPASFTAACRDAVLQGAARAGHKAYVIDLAAEDFDPRLSTDEHACYATPDLPQDLRAHLDLLHWADGLIFTAPVWWGHLPPLLSGWASRLLRPGIAFDIAPSGRLRPRLDHIRTLGLVTSTGAPALYWRVLRRSPERGFLTSIGPCFNRNAKQLHLALHRIDQTSPDTRTAFLARVAERVARLTK